jgi:formylglycine-generating enzyme required for sulfatase activity
VTFISVPDAATTRVTDNSHWQVGDRIGIYMVEAGKQLAPETIVNETANRQYIVEQIQGNQAVFVPATAHDTIFIPIRKEVNFIAYYPYTPAIDKNFNFPITNLENQNLNTPPDLLFSNTKEAYSGGTSPKNIPLLFHHQMAKIDFKIIRTPTAPPQISSMVVEIYNVQVNPTSFNLAHGTMAEDGAVLNTSLTAHIHFLSGDTAMAKALLIPVKNADIIKVVVQLENGLHKYRFPFKGSEGNSLRAATTYSREIFLGDPIPIDWVPISAGVFLMGSSLNEVPRQPDETQHQVTLTQNFKMSKYEITCEQYAAFLSMKKVGSNGKDNVEGFGLQSLINISLVRLKWENSQWKPEAGRENHPITHVSWYGAKAFADWMGCSLPTEAQMEYALRAGTQTTYFFGNNAGDIDRYVWSQKNSGGSTHPVGQKSPNPWGLHDIVGNVHEHCADLYQKDLGIEPVIDPVGASSGDARSHRGGSFTDDSTRYQRSAARSASGPASSFWNVGFRIVYIP